MTLTTSMDLWQARRGKILGNGACGNTTPPPKPTHEVIRMAICPYSTSTCTPSEAL
jgi:hypothetical protein